MWLLGQGQESEQRCHGLLAKVVSEKEKQLAIHVVEILLIVLMHTFYQLIVHTNDFVFRRS